MKKKLLLCMATCASVMLILACASTKAKELNTQEEVNDALREVYNEYRSDIILTGAKNHNVTSGDTLSAIARREYNDGFYFPLIMLASSDVILDPDKIAPGMKLTIPDLQRNLNDAKARKSLKEFLGEIAGVYDRRPNRSADADGLRRLAAAL